MSQCFFVNLFVQPRLQFRGERGILRRDIPPLAGSILPVYRTLHLVEMEKLFPRLDTISRRWICCGSGDKAKSGFAIMPPPTGLEKVEAFDSTNMSHLTAFGGFAGLRSKVNAAWVHARKRRRRRCRLLRSLEVVWECRATKISPLTGLGGGQKLVNNKEQTRFRTLLSAAQAPHYLRLRVNQKIPPAVTKSTEACSETRMSAPIL
jgi:hypothetical protein